MQNSPAIHLTDADFDSEATGSEVPVLVDFGSTWCPPCNALSPVIDQLAGEYAGRAKVAKFNTEENPNIAARYSISLLPTVIVFKNGLPASKIIGLKSKKEYMTALDAAIAQ